MPNSPHVPKISANVLCAKVGKSVLVMPVNSNDSNGEKNPLPKTGLDLKYSIASFISRILPPPE